MVTIGLEITELRLAGGPELGIRRGQRPLLVSVFAVLKPAVLAIVLMAAWRIGSRTLRNPLLVGWRLPASWPSPSSSFPIHCR